MARALLATIRSSDLGKFTFGQQHVYAAEALRLAQEIGDERLALEARMAVWRFAPMKQSVAEAEAVMAELEARGDLAMLNRLLFDQMWRLLVLGDLERGLATCDRGIDLAARLGLPPVQYPTLKAFNLMTLGRFARGRRIAPGRDRGRRPPVRSSVPR